MNPSDEQQQQHLESIREYLAQHKLEQLFKDLMATLLLYKPDDPHQFILDAIVAVQEHNKEKGTPLKTYMELFRELIFEEHTEEGSEASDSEQNAEEETNIRKAPPLRTESQNHVQIPLKSDHLGVKYNLARRGSVSAESLKPQTGSNPERIIIPKSDEAKIRIASAISNNLLFRNLEKDQKSEVVDAMFEKAVPKGTSIIRQGEEGDNFYVVDEGLFEVYVNGKKVVEIGPGGSFGELALMYNTPRAATVTAALDSILWAVDRVTFRRIIMDNTFQKRKLYESFLKTVPILQSLSAAEVTKVADALEPVSFDDEDIIIEEGDVGDGFYIILSGEARVLKRVQDGEGAEEEDEQIEVNRLHKGDYFGELALLTDKPRAATVTAVGPTECVCLDTKAFIRLLGPCVDILKRNAANYRRYQAALEDNHVEIPKQEAEDDD